MEYQDLKEERGNRRQARQVTQRFHFMERDRERSHSISVPEDPFAQSFLY